MGMQKPELHDFDITPEQYAICRPYAVSPYNRTDSVDFPSCGLGCLVALAIIVLPCVGVIFYFGEGFSWVFWALLTVPFLTWGISSALQGYRRRRLLKGPVGSQIELYEEAVAAYQAAQWKDLEAQRTAARAQQATEKKRRAVLAAERRKREKYWKSMSGVEFERELAQLYMAQGYRVQLTPKVGDGGIDLILEKNGKTTVVQCKAHKKPVAPYVVRDLYGSMMSYGADDAILACTGGFSKGVVKFAQGKPIKLISASDIARVAQRSNQASDVIESPRRAARIRSAPVICPIPGCGSEMKLRRGRYGRFWGCSKYPACRGTRDD